MLIQLLSMLAAIAMMCAAVQTTKNTKWEKAVLTLVSAAYLGGLIGVTCFLGGRPGSSGVSFRLPLPFWEALRTAQYGLSTNRSMLNLLLFVPLGYLLSRIFRLSWHRALLFSFCVSALIELSQYLFRFGVLELDDLVKNSLGGLLGWLLCRKLNERKPEKGEERPSGAFVCPEQGQEEGREENVKPLDKESRLLLAAARAGALGETPVLPEREKLWEDLDRNRFISLAYANSVIGPVYAGLEKLAQEELEPLKKALRRLYGPTFARTINQDEEGRKLLDAFEAAGLDCIPLKGMDIRQLYADPMLRSMTDLDLLVRDYAFDKICAIMTDLGYQSEGKSNWKHGSFIKAPYLTVEPHRRLTDDTAQIRDWEKRIWDRCSLRKGREHIYRMAPEDAYLFHVVHMAKDLRYGKLDLRRIMDTWLFLTRGPAMDRDLVEKELGSMELDVFARRIEKLALACFEGGEWESEGEVILHFLLDPEKDGAKLYPAGKIAATPGGTLRQAKRRARLRAVFLPYSLMKAQYPITERFPLLTPFCWCLRLGRLLRKIGASKDRFEGLQEVSEDEFRQMRRIFDAAGL